MNYVGIPGIKTSYRGESSPVISPEKIINAVCKYLYVNFNALKGKSRLSMYVHARHVIFYFLRKHTKLSLKAMAEIFHRDHTTVIHGLQKLSDIMATEPAVKSEIEELQNIITEIGAKEVQRKFIN